MDLSGSPEAVLRETNAPHALTKEAPLARAQAYRDEHGFD
jgi:hypothetical protein